MINKDEISVMRNNKENYLFRSWLFANQVTFIDKAVLFIVFLFLSLGVSANTVSKDLTITAHIMKDMQGNGSDGSNLSIEADEQYINATFSESAGTFAPVSMLFKVFSNESYKLEIKEFKFQCKGDSETEWDDKDDLLDIYFDHDPAPLAFNKTRQASSLHLLGEGYAAPTSGGENVKPNSYTRDVWNSWYREHEFKINYKEFPLTDEEQRCEGAIGVVATSMI